MLKKKIWDQRQQMYVQITICLLLSSFTFLQLLNNQTFLSLKNTQFISGFRFRLLHLVSKTTANNSYALST